ncbi:hypothetical protein FKG94_15605 [Exilibacterium tricleocarpae]|uniref:Water stress and hypersensitive response domain-containing protein n=1 Tax=Exilibacterium tricleocarpae TaxID=2591008 RepID=A0A545TFN8_9GAMM|nr:LEA type 2 family protein [Exilibacterium tricleocarpae]TQV76033.1 hypothetical protein FKG94_15605 [Exilibacterium tricleocarpae]
MMRCYFLWILLLGLSGCATLQQVVEPPQVELTGIRLLPARGLTQQFEVDLALTNPNAVTLSVVGMSYSVSLEGHDIISGVANDIAPLEPYTEVPVTLVASTNLVSALGLIETFMRRPRNEVNYVLGAKLDLGTWLPPFKVERQGVIPLTRQ